MSEACPSRSPSSAAGGAARCSESGDQFMSLVIPAVLLTSVLRVSGQSLSRAVPHRWNEKVLIGVGPIVVATSLP